MVTASVQAKGPIFVLSATSAVRAFDAFAGDNDPHGEHDFGAFDLCGERLFSPVGRGSRFLAATVIHMLELAQHRIAVSIAALKRARAKPPPPPSPPRHIKSMFHERAQPRRRLRKKFRPR